MVMDRMQRSLGRLRNKGPGNNAKVSSILKDFEDADQIVDGCNTLRDSWVNLTNHQAGIAREYQGLYDPIVCATEPTRRASQATPELQVNRTFALQKTYTDLKDEVLQEVVALDAQVIRPASDARKCLHSIRKTIKKREDKMSNYDKTQDKVKKLHSKSISTPKEEAAVAKAENDMALAQEEFQIADDHLSSTLPPLVQACFSLIPCLLAGIITIENRLLGLYYTVLHEYCADNSFPSPPPPMSDVVAQFTAEYQSVQSEAESLNTLAQGKAIHQPMTSEPPTTTLPRPSGIRRITTGFGGKDKQQQQQQGATEDTPNPRPMRIASTPSVAPSNASTHSASTDRPGELSRQASRSNIGLPTDFTTASHIDRSSPAVTPSYNASREKTDYFGHQSQLQAPATNGGGAIRQYKSMNSLNGSNGGAGGASAAASAAAAKKKPPPPPPPKKRVQLEYVIAEHAYPGGQEGDLSFEEGDQIRIVKKTATMDDWWEGELRGVKGHFPANYCRMA